MASQDCHDFVKNNTKANDFNDKSIIEVGSRNVNGSIREFISSYNPSSYLGVDIIDGTDVDELCDAENLIDCYGHDAFDVVVSMEVLEHVRDWRKVIKNLKGIVKSGGLLLLTTRSKGFYYHGYPHDYWRYELEDMKEIFSDCTLEVLKSDPTQPGVFIRVKKPLQFIEKDLAQIDLYSIIKRKRVNDITTNEEALFSVEWRVRQFLAKFVPKNQAWRFGIS